MQFKWIIQEEEILSVLKRIIVWSLFTSGFILLTVKCVPTVSSETESLSLSLIRCCQFCPLRLWALSQENLSSEFWPGKTQTCLLSYRD